MRASVIFLLIVSMINLIQLVLGNSFNGAKVIVHSDTKTIIIQSIAVIVLGYLALKLKWEEH